MSNFYGISELALPVSSPPAIPEQWEKWGRVARTKTLGTAWGYHFYTSDHQFTGCYADPDKLVESGVSHAVELNYSTYEGIPRAEFLGDLVRKRAISAYWQRLGVTIWVDMNVEPHLYDLNSLGIPNGYPYYATRYQKTYPDGRPGGIPDLERDYLNACRTAGIPQVQFLVYSGGPEVERVCKDRGWVWVPDSIKTLTKAGVIKEKHSKVSTV